MNVKEFAFNQGPHVPDDNEHVVLTCKDCGNTEIKPKVDPYSGHMYEQVVTYTCTVCRGNMNLLIEDDEENDNE